MCVMRQNWHELPEFISLCNELNAAAVLHKVWFPSAYALHNLSASELQEICNSLSSFTYRGENPLQQRNMEHYRYFVSVIQGWQKDAAEKEKNIPGKLISPARLFQLIIEKISAHLQRMNLSEEEQSKTLAVCSGKLAAVVELFPPDERDAILRLLYLENPAKITEPLKQQPVRLLYENARKFLMQDKSAAPAE